MSSSAERRRGRSAAFRDLIPRGDGAPPDTPPPGPTCFPAHAWACVPPSTMPQNGWRCGRRHSPKTDSPIRRMTAAEPSSGARDRGGRPRRNRDWCDAREAHRRCPHRLPGMARRRRGAFAFGRRCDPTPPIAAARSGCATRQQALSACWIVSWRSSRIRSCWPAWKAPAMRTTGARALPLTAARHADGALKRPRHARRAIKGSLDGKTGSGGSR